MWARLDDAFPDHPKVASAGPLAGWLHVCGLCYANRYLTDGFIPIGQVRKLADVDGALELAERLVAVRLWETASGGYQIHDFLEYNVSRAEQLARNAAKHGAKAEAGRLGGIASGESRRLTSNEAQTQANAKHSRSTAEANDEAQTQANSKQKRTPVPDPVPVPSSPDPVPEPTTTNARPRETGGDTPPAGAPAQETFAGGGEMLVTYVSLTGMHADPAERAALSAALGLTAGGGVAAALREAMANHASHPAAYALGIIKRQAATNGAAARASPGATFVDQADGTFGGWRVSNPVTR